MEPLTASQCNGGFRRTCFSLSRVENKGSEKQSVESYHPKANSRGHPTASVRLISGSIAVFSSLGLPKSHECLKNRCDLRVSSACETARDSLREDWGRGLLQVVADGADALRK